MLIALLGKSGSGKDTILERMNKELGINKIINYTSRSKRLDDRPDSYYYLNDSKFKELISENFFIQHKFYFGEYYGLCARDFENINNNDYAFITGKDGISIISAKLPQTISIYLEVSDIERYNRMKSRGDDEKKIQERIDKDKIYFSDIEEYINVKINNDGDIKETLNKINQVILLKKQLEFCHRNSFMTELNKMLTNISQRYMIYKKTYKGEI